MSITFDTTRMRLATLVIWGAIFLHGTVITVTAQTRAGCAAILFGIVLAAGTIKGMQLARQS